MNRLVVIAAAAAATVIAVVITAASGAEPSTVVVAGLGAAGMVGFVAPALTRFVTARGHVADSILDIVGVQGLVVAQIPYDGHGTISVRAAGQLRTLSARSPYPIGVGRLVVVTAVTSETSVVVEAAEPPEPRRPDDRPV